MFFGLIFLSSLFFSNFLLQIMKNKKNTSLDDIKIYKKIFEIQKLPIKK